MLNSIGPKYRSAPAITTVASATLCASARRSRALRSAVIARNIESAKNGVKRKKNFNANDMKSENMARILPKSVRRMAIESLQKNIKIVQSRHSATRLDSTAKPLLL